MYVIRNDNSKPEINLVIESKDYSDEEDLKGIEIEKMKHAEKFFDAIKCDGFNVHFRRQLNTKAVSDIIKEIASIK
jgi:restriction endonuclease